MGARRSERNRGSSNRHCGWQTAVIHAMASLPEPERVKFWHEQFAPFAAEEHALREKPRVTVEGTPPGGRVQ